MKRLMWGVIGCSVLSLVFWAGVAGGFMAGKYSSAKEVELMRSQRNNWAAEAKIFKEDLRALEKEYYEGAGP